MPIQVAWDGENTRIRGRSREAQVQKETSRTLSGLRLASLSLNLSCTSGVSKLVTGFHRKSL
jgi:hypothetical protein